MVSGGKRAGYCETMSNSSRTSQHAQSSMGYGGRMQARTRHTQVTQSCQILFSVGRRQLFWLTRIVTVKYCATLC
eukprot:1287682-Amphidinium_carterae.1